MLGNAKARGILVYAAHVLINTGETGERVLCFLPSDSGLRGGVVLFDGRWGGDLEQEKIYL
jgi:hypothetical protein